MRIKIPEFDSQKDKFKYLADNKKRLIAQKKSLPITSAPIVVRKDALKKYEGMTAEGLMFKFQPLANYDQKVFEMYKAGEINQHSIGLQYVKLELAINDPDFKEEFEVWEKYFDQIINKEEAERQGMFWAVKESKIFENSAVLFGANLLTPVVNTEIKDDEVIVTAVGNLANFMDKHRDVMLPGNWNKSIQERANLIPILKDHRHSIDARVARTLNVYTDQMSVSDLYKRVMTAPKADPKQGQKDKSFMAKMALSEFK